jgi:hypothetical protein
MKSFSDMKVQLNEAKFKIPRGEKELKRDVAKVGGSKVEIVYTDKNGKVNVYMDGNIFSEKPYKDLKSAESEMKQIKSIMSSADMQELKLEDIINEINS